MCKEILNDSSMKNLGDLTVYWGLDWDLDKD